MKARGPPESPDMPGSTAGRSEIGSGLPTRGLSNDGMAVAGTVAVELGFVESSTVPTLDIETGLVCICSLLEEKGFSGGIDIACAAVLCASRMVGVSRMIVSAGEVSLALPKRLERTAAAGFGLVCLDASSALSSARRR